MSQSSRTVFELPHIPSLPGNLDVTKKLWAESEFSEESMDAKMHRLRGAIADAKKDGVPLPKEFHGLAIEVGVWVSDPSSTPVELATTVDKTSPNQIRERLHEFFDTDLGAKFMTISPEDRQKMITQVGVDFD